MSSYQHKITENWLAQRAKIWSTEGTRQYDVGMSTDEISNLHRKVSRVLKTNEKKNLVHTHAECNVWSQKSKTLVWKRGVWEITRQDLTPLLVIQWTQKRRPPITEQKASIMHHSLSFSFKLAGGGGWWDCSGKLVLF